MSESTERGDGAWTLLTGHGHVLVEITRHPQARIRDIAAVCGLTERAVQAIVADLEAVGYLTRTRTGRRTVYTVDPDMLFRHSAQDGHRVGPFLALLAAVDDPEKLVLTRGAPPPHGLTDLGGRDDRRGHGGADKPLPDVERRGLHHGMEDAQDG
jgi:hypothetical protein